MGHELDGGFGVEPSDVAYSLLLVFVLQLGEGFGGNLLGGLAGVEVPKLVKKHTSIFSSLLLFSSLLFSIEHRFNLS